MQSPSDSIPIVKGSLPPVMPLRDYAAKASATPLLVTTSYGDKNEEFGRLYGLALGPTGLIVVSDWKQNKLILFDKNMKFKSIIGSSSIFKRDECFSKPSGMASDTVGNIYVADRENHCVKKFSIVGKFLMKIGTGKAGSKNGELNSPRAVVISSQDIVYVADCDNHRIQVFFADGKFKVAFGSLGSNPGQFHLPCGVALSSSEEKLIVTDNQNHRIQVLNAEQGSFLHQFVHDDIHFPHGLSCNKDDHLLICCSGKSYVLVCREDGTMVAKIKGTLDDGEQRFGVPGEAKMNSNGQIIIVARNHIAVF